MERNSPQIPLMSAIAQSWHLCRKEQFTFLLCFTVSKCLRSSFVSYSKQRWRPITFILFYQFQYPGNYWPQRKRLTLWWWLTNSLESFWFQLLIQYIFQRHSFKDQKKPPWIPCSLRQNKLHRKERITVQIPFPNLAKKWLKERCSFSSHSSKWVPWPLCYKGGLPGLALGPLNIVSEFILNKFHQIHPKTTINQSNATSKSSVCPPQTFVQIYCYFIRLSTIKLLSLALHPCHVMRSNGISILRNPILKR